MPWIGIDAWWNLLTYYFQFLLNFFRLLNVDEDFIILFQPAIEVGTFEDQNK